jgi:predicted TIM-barrel fold metal-dependent hydrolase
VFDTAGLRHALDVIGAERILYSVDYPYESPIEARDWFNSLDLPAEQLDMIAAGNARRLLRL